MGRGAEGAHIAHIVKAFESFGHTVLVLSPPGVDPLAMVGAKPLDKTDEKTKGFSNIWKLVSRYAPQLFFEFLEVGYNFLAIPRIIKAIRQKNIDFVYERNAFFLFAGAYSSKKCKIPLIVEANEAVGVKRARKLTLVRLARLCERYTLGNAQETYTVSSYLAKMLQKNAPSESRIHVLPNAIDPLRFSQRTNREKIRKRFRISNMVVIGFAGWFDWWDRLDLLIDLQKELVEQGYDNVVTMLIGHGNMADELQKQINNMGLLEKVIMTGAIEKQDVLDYIDALDIGILAHSNEFGSPMVLFEMMALGKCVVAPDLAPITDIIIDGKNGLLFPQLNAKILKLKIIGLLEDKNYRYLIGVTAQKMIFENNTWQKNAHTILQSSMFPTGEL